MVSGIYDEPEMYELACAYRYVPAEVDALLRWWRAHAASAACQGAVLELAAGPAGHALELARRGLRATALDISPAMCARAREKAKQAGLELTVAEADMRDFSIPGSFGLVITMLNSVCHLMILDDLVSHLRSVAAHTAGGGLYIMELAHPADHLGRASRTATRWQTDLDGTRVRVSWGGPGDAIDPVTQVTMEHVSITVRGPKAVRTLTGMVANRFWTATEVDAAVRLAGGFTIAACYGDFGEDISLASPGAWRMIMVLRRD